MKFNKIICSLFLLIALGYTAFAGESIKKIGKRVNKKEKPADPIYKNPKANIEDRVNDLLSRMTPEEKFWQLFMIPGDLDGVDKSRYKNGIFGLQVSAVSQGGGGANQMLSYNTQENAYTLAKKINAIQRYFIKETRLGIPIIAFDEALHGLVRQGATAFPQAIGLAASFDTLMMSRVAGTIAQETKLRGIRDILTPVINIASDVRWGRTEETYGEDPFLTSQMGLAFVKAFETQNIITTPKHFVANVGDGGRDSYPIHFNERLLEEIYFPPFKTTVQQGKSRSLMTAYNTVDGTPATSNYNLLTQKLKIDWGFKGFVISDAGAVGGANVLHYTSANYAEATKQAIIGGLDVIFQTEFDHYKLFIPPFLDGSIPQKRIDDAVARVLRAKFELGLFENPYVSESEAQKAINDKSHKVMAKEAALKSFVLLKNEKSVLPFKDVKNILVLGEDATEARLGGYSGSGNGKISILDGLKKRAGQNVNIVYSKGSSRIPVLYTPIDQEFLKADTAKGLAAEYFDNLSLSGNPVLSRIDQVINFMWTLHSPNKKLAKDQYSIRWKGTVSAPKSGTYQIGLEGNDGYRLYLDGKLLIDRWEKRSYHTQLVPFRFEANKNYNIQVEFKESKGNAYIKLVWDYNVPNTLNQQLEEAVKLAKDADAIVVAAGIKEGEFLDRAMLSLPGNQEQLIKDMENTGKPVIVLLVGGSAITMNNWFDQAAAVLNIWYPGEEGGNAVAETLFGDYNPAGRLPITYPIHESQLPLIYNHKPTGRGDDYNNLSGEPLFPFGFGLSYSTFDYKDLKLSKKQINAKESITADFTLQNTGKYDGEEVVQLYIRDLLSSVARPVLELKGFQRVKLKAGESKRLSFAISPDMLQMLNAEMETLTEPGDFRIMIGSSSKELQLKDTLTVIK
ncbi:glycoside hydrolase family 3 C-terminal domain-containing protein [Pedobacter punctiformis]|uniref:Glycoside hydrolase family 3 C-terminal domain-containing protein n=1 Tax=Pedobacter punctiformis TaxID=3004097 RepID=A0ABT4LCA6_9SPHI|nr:glycoside hydrolase family 3 C-terminal domain-containing protein [Pedobacter sp. HCMS5-2]MCZ4245560.1 glycoside hydrolase family 3 C-terminal domain-containing protein [Pedobacter sp. HCMS5-2]